MKRGEMRRRAMLRAAEALFLERGFEGTTLDEIILRAGGSRATIYAGFGNKEGLFTAIVAELCTTLLAPLEAAMDAGSPPAKVLDGFARGVMRRLMEPANIALYRLVIGEGQRFPELAAQVFRAGPETAAARLADYLRQETRRGRLAVDDPDAAARTFLEMIKGDLHTRALFGLKPPSAKQVDGHCRRAVRIFVDGVLPK